MKIKDLPKIDLPRERLEKYGVKKLDDFELLAILLGSGIEGLNVIQLSKKILNVVRKIGVKKITLADLLKVKGLGKAKASQFLAVIELGDRLNKKSSALSAKDVWNICADIRESKKEQVVVLYLDSHNTMIERQIISVGTLTASLIHPREVFEPAIRLSASAIIFAHNHPSGDPEPSEEDLAITKRLVDAGKILGIEIIDHVIVAKEKFVSLKEKGNI
jgi:DNA repair protein RadC